jgi:hypothetical protein
MQWEPDNCVTPNYKDTHRNKSEHSFFWLLFIMGVSLITS